MYWLLRRNQAKDFLYEENIPDTAAVLRKRYGTDAEAALAAAVAPQKQHIIPYSQLKDLFGLVGGRPGRHEVHDLGNLTYISAGLNSFKTGLGSKPIRLRAEPPRNRHAHMLLEAELLHEYEDAISLDSKTAKASYRRFCDARRRLIIERFLAWEQETRGVSQHVAADQTIVTAPRLVDPRPEDVIRAFKYSSTVTAILLTICDENGGRMESTASQVSIGCRTKTAGGGIKQQLRIDLHKDGARLGLKVSDQGLATRFRSRFPQVWSEAKPRMRAAFTDKKRNRLLIDCHGIDEQYTIKVIHKTVSSDGHTVVDKKVGMVAECAGRDAALKQFEDFLTDAVSKGWRRTGKGKAFKCQISDPELMAEAATWLQAQMRSGSEGPQSR